MRLIIFTCLPLFLNLLINQASADSLIDLPPQWQHLEAVIEVDISSLTPHEQQSINDGRKEVDALLVSDNVDSKLLASAYGALGNLYLAHEIFTTADACYNNAIRLEPGNFPWLYYSGYLAQENGKMQTALSRYKDAIQLDPDYPPAQYRLAQIFLELNQPGEAQKRFESLLDTTGYQAAAHNGIGQALLLRQEYQDAVEHFTKALELRPEATQLHYPLAMALRATGNKELAKKHLQKLGKREIEIKDPLVESLEALKDPASRYFIAAMSAVLKHDYDDAISKFEIGFEFAPNNAAARTSYARVLYLRKYKDRSREQLIRVVAQNPDKTLALFLLAVLYDESKEENEAAKLYRRVLELDPQHEGANFYLGNYYLRAKDYTNAIKHYQATTLNNERNIPAHMFKLVANMGIGASDKELISTSRQITSRAPNILAIKRIEILLLALSKDKDVQNSQLAVEMAERTYEQAQYPVNLELLALANASAGRFNPAIEQMREAITKEQHYKNSRNISRMKTSLVMLEQKKLPALKWQEEIAHMMPPSTTALATFRDYPDANPI